MIPDHPDNLPIVNKVLNKTQFEHDGGNCENAPNFGLHKFFDSSAVLIKHAVHLNFNFYYPHLFLLILLLK